MSQYSDSVKDFGDQLTEGLERVQEFQLEQLRTWQSTMAQFSSMIPMPTLPENDSFPSLENVVKANFKLAERLLENQRKFALGVSEVLSTPTEEAAEN